MIYYRYLFQNMGELSPNEKLVYSALIYHSISYPGEHYDADGNFDKSLVMEFIQDNATNEGLEYTYYYPMSISKLAKFTEMTRVTVRKVMDSLRYKHHLFNDNIIVCPLRLIDMGFINNPSRGLKGQQLVFYLYLKDRSYHYNGVIDTWASGLAKGVGITKKNAYDILAILEGHKFVERLPNGKLKVL